MQATQEPDTRNEEERFTIPQIEAVKAVTPIVPTRALIVLTPPEEQEPIEAEVTVLDAPKRRIPYFLVAICIALLCIVALCSLFLYPLFFPNVTVTIIPKSERVTTTQAIQLPARLLAPLTLTQSQTVPATGHGHQAARKAVGTITFYNGLFSSQQIAAGTILTNSNRQRIITDQLAILPAANPPAWGIATVSAHAQSTGIQGNIAAYTINQACCGVAVKAVNTRGFTGGQNERFFKIVTQQDIDRVSLPLKDTLNRSVQEAFQAQLTPDEALITPPCSETVLPDHKPGDEAISVTVTVSATCSAIAYDKQSLQKTASQLLSTTAQKQLGAGYSLLGDAQITINHSAIQNSRAILEITSSGTWMYQLNSNEQERLLHLIAGKGKSNAIHILLSEPGIQGVTITGISDNAILPGDTSHIHILLVFREM